MTTAEALTEARRQDSAARRQRVLQVLQQLNAAGENATVSQVARAARVHRSFIYRHDDLHTAVLAQATAPTETVTGTVVSRESLLVELANAAERDRRQAARIKLLEDRLSDALGEAVWRETGLGAPADLDALQRRITQLEQQETELRRQLAERTEELDAARGTNRDLMAQLNRRTLS
ncbi:hypothetical protein MOQ72_36170 [Saccharopolyspora sp. K220]|uniref:hypothetical protein n=1 Tax=Saccharopolyspora soli TaxID=2926618 RepID=UPI001F5928E4|nr:hypothetical protein [Saccharopolyspora soli]MCI2422875.1 hypothetical protein [Saccharopolyspora soli]